MDAGALAPKREDIARLLEQLPAIEQAWNDNRQLAQSIEDAGALYKKGYFSKAAAAYGEVLARNADSSAAKEGFDKSVAALVAHARSAVNRGDFTTARKSLASATNLAPGNAAGAALLADLPGLEQAWQQQQAAAAQEKEAARQLANTGITAVTDGDLDMAADTYLQLAATYPELPATRSLKNQLLSAYIAFVREEITSKEYDSAEEYLSRGQVLAPNYAAWPELEEEIEISRSSNRRRIGAY